MQIPCVICESSECDCININTKAVSVITQYYANKPYTAHRWKKQELLKLTVPSSEYTPKMKNIVMSREKHTGQSHNTDN